MVHLDDPTDENEYESGSHNAQTLQDYRFEVQFR